MRVSRRWMWAFLAAVMLGAASAAPARAEELKMSKVYMGVIGVGGPGDDGKYPAAHAIRTQKELDAFIARIPKKQISPTATAPPSDDPLLKHPKIDLNRFTAIAAYSGSMYVIPVVRQLERKGGGVVVKVSREPVEGAEVMQRPLGVGAYQLVLVPRFSGSVTEIDISPKKP